MSETPPWSPFGDDAPEPPPAVPQPDPAPAHRPGKRPFPFLPVGLAAGGIAVGVIVTLLITSGGSGKTAPVAAPAPTRTSSSPSAKPSATPTPKKTTAKKTSKAPTPTVMPPAAESGLSHEAPTAVQIPKIGVSSSLVSLGLQADGTLQVPSDFAVAGWYANGAFPGDDDAPPALIVGHVDDYKGPAVFYRLKELTAGDKVIVPRTDGSVATFIVYKTESYLKDQFPSQQVYAETSRPELRLITCTGQFDSGAKSYLSNFVAYAYLESGTG